MLIFSSSIQDDALLFGCAKESVSSSSSYSSNVMSGGNGIPENGFGLKSLFVLFGNFRGKLVLFFVNFVLFVLNQEDGENEKSPFKRLGFGGPFTPSQKMELQRQIHMFKCIKSGVPVPSELLISSGLPRPKTFGAGLFQIGFVSYLDPEPGRCRRTDGRKWRCSREAIPYHKYCERHINRGRNRSRKSVEGHTSHALKLVPSSSKLARAGSSSNFPVTKKSRENLQAAIVDSSPAQLNRMIPISTEHSPSAALTSVPPPPDFVLSSNDSLMYLPTNSFSQNCSFLSPVESHCQTPYNSINELSSCSSSPLPENLIFSPPDLTNEFAAFDPIFDACPGVEHSLNIMSGASMNGPLQEVLANNNIEYVNCSLSSNDIRTDEWDLSPEFCSSITNVQPNDFPSTIAAGSCNKGCEDFCSSSNTKNSPTFPPL